MNGPYIRSHPARPDLENMVKRVESLGISCELGLVQRRCMAEPLGLYRFSLTPLDGLVDALNATFDGIADPGQLRLSANAYGEWSCRHERYGFEFHTGHPTADHTEDDVRGKLQTRFPFLARRLIEDLEAADKLFAYRPLRPRQGMEKARDLLRAMRRFGPAILIWMDATPDLDQVGTAEWAAPGDMITGYLDRFAPTYAASTASFDAWLGALTMALALADNHRGSGEIAQPPANARTGC